MIPLAEVPRLGGLELAARRVVDGLRAGRHRSPSLGPAAEFHDHRPYLPGDDLRRVDWKAFARCDRLLLRRTREERDLPLVLVLDTSASMAYGQPSKLAWAQLAGAALAVLAGDQGDRMRLASGAGALDQWSDEGDGAAGAARLCVALDRLTASGPGAAADLLAAAAARLRRRSLIVLLSDLLDDPVALGRAAAALAGRGHELAVIHVHDASEAALPAEWGASTFTDPEGRSAPRTCEAAAVKDAYDAAWQRHTAVLAERCAAVRADLVPAQTSHEVAAILGGWLRRRGRR
jgi:uncharacterized protein (DUF58 family)